jgi:hypothetical protein
MPHASPLPALVAALSACATAHAQVGDVIGLVDTRPPDHAELRSPGAGAGAWINVVDEPATIGSAFTGLGIMDRGFTGVGHGYELEVSFDDPVVNIGLAGAMMVVDAWEPVGSYELATDWDGFATWLPIVSAPYWGGDRSYFIEGAAGGPTEGTVWGAYIHIGQWGVPTGGAVTTFRLRVNDPGGLGGADPLGLVTIVPAPGPAAWFALALLSGPRRRR